MSGTSTRIAAAAPAHANRTVYYHCWQQAVLCPTVRPVRAGVVTGHRVAGAPVNNISRHGRSTPARCRNGQTGFTLIELLVVIIIIAILAAVAIPVYLGQRSQAQDAAAMVLTRNALTMVQTAFVDEGDYRTLDAAALASIDDTINWVIAAGDLVTTVPAWVNPAVPARAQLMQVAVYPESRDIVDIACISDSGNLFGIQINTVTLGESGYAKVRVVDGSTKLGW